LLGTPSVHTIHDYYPLAIEDGDRLAPMADELIDRMVILVAFPRFHGMGAANSRALCSDNIMSTCNISFVDLVMFPFDVFGGMCGENFRNVFMLLFMVLWVPIFATLCRRAVLMLWHAFLFLRLWHVFF
jgi:hypothetical protein